MLKDNREKYICQQSEILQLLKDKKQEHLINYPNEIEDFLLNLKVIKFNSIDNKVTKLIN